MSEFDDTLLDEDLLSLPSVSDYEETLYNHSIEASDQEDSIDEILNINLLEALRELNEEICMNNAVAKQNNFINHKRNLIVYDIDYYDVNHNQNFELKKNEESIRFKESSNNVKDLRNKLKKLKKQKKHKKQKPRTGKLETIATTGEINEHCSSKQPIVSESQEPSVIGSPVNTQSQSQNLNLPISVQISESQITKSKKCNNSRSNSVDLIIPSANAPSNVLESCLLYSKFLTNQEGNQPITYDCQSEKNYRAQNASQNYQNGLVLTKGNASFQDNVLSVPHNDIYSENRNNLPACQNQTTSLSFCNLKYRDESLILSKNQSIQCNELTVPLSQQYALSSQSIGINPVGNFSIQETNWSYRQPTINQEYLPSSFNLTFHPDNQQKQNKGIQNIQLINRLGPSPSKTTVPSSMNHQNYPFNNSHLMENSVQSKSNDDQLLFVLDKLNPRNDSQTSFTRNHNFTQYQTQNKDLNKDSRISTQKNDYEKSLYVSTKRDDPITYFSDIWQTKKKTDINKPVIQKQLENKTKIDLKKNDQKLKVINSAIVTKQNKLKHTCPRSDDKSKKNSPPTSLKNNTTKVIGSIHKKKDKKCSTENTLENSTKKTSRSEITKEQSKFNNDLKKKQNDEDIAIIFTMDDDMREYCKKIEEQKKRRQEFLEEKEKKRKLLEKLKISEGGITKDV
ncbi:histone-lysine N-methyltransferase, H3 lysine-79 specific-like isoform X2 [Trichogramma pretiosum]|uniref:histone-lysine N-methyltransferase, H3 lysine-79 specific-like isoform X2 n=1 Tax=Trichogramma pretiosum TaxID=7493 RepID=UPI000C71C448|nr:histone-lysine N-methyltransferase, H3 lysine-79 specific-like isoform X2 [Trichogramma pretiosum]